MLALYRTLLISEKRNTIYFNVKIESALVCYKVGNRAYSLMMEIRQTKQQQAAKFDP